MTLRRVSALLRLLLRCDVAEYLLGDLEEEYGRRAARNGTLSAQRWYLAQSIRLVLAFPRWPTPRHGNAAHPHGDGIFISLMNDLRYGGRALMKSRGYSFVAVLTLALAIGANTVIFSFSNVLLLKPLPLLDPERIAFVYSVDMHSMPRGRMSFADYRDLRDRSRAFASLAAWTDDDVTLTGHGEPLRLQARRVTPNLFSTWGLVPVAGRLLRDGVDTPGRGCTVVLSDHLWGTLFQRNPLALATSMAIDGQACAIVGVMTPAIEIGNLSLVDLWMPHREKAMQQSRDDRIYATTGRLNQGVTIEQAASELKAIAEQLQREHPDTNTGWTTRTLPTKQAMVGENGRLVFALLMLVVAFVLLIACANVANLMLARATGRRREFAVRVALGATRAVVVRQLIAESLCVGVTAGLLGVSIAEAGLRAIRAASYRAILCDGCHRSECARLRHCTQRADAAPVQRAAGRARGIGRIRGWASRRRPVRDDHRRPPQP